MKIDLKNVKELTTAFKETASLSCQKLKRDSEALIQACNKIEKSWSGSFAGWHGRMYFKNFEKPQLQERFSGEWGGIHGIPDVWQEKDSEEVKSVLEKMVSEDFSIDVLEKEAKALQQNAEQIKNELVITLSAINLSSFPDEQTLKTEVENIKFGKGKNHFINKYIPKSLMTRDQGALMEGICIPSHTYYLGLAQSVIDTCGSVEHLVQLVDRLIRQIELKPTSTPLKAKNVWNWFNPFWLIWKIILLLNRLVKLAWKHKIFSAILVLLTLLALDYSLAWKNLQIIWSWLKLI